VKVGPESVVGGGGDSEGVEEWAGEGPPRGGDGFGGFGGLAGE